MNNDNIREILKDIFGMSLFDVKKIENDKIEKAMLKINSAYATI